MQRTVWQTEPISTHSAQVKDFKHNWAEVQRNLYISHFVDNALLFFFVCFCATMPFKIHTTISAHIL